MGDVEVIEIALTLLGCIMAAFVIACVVAFWTGFFQKLWHMWKALNRDAELWRHGQKPIGRIVSMSETERGLEITGQMFEGMIPGHETPPMSIGYTKGERAEPTYDVWAMPDPNCAVLSYKFKFNREDLLFETPESIKIMVDQRIANFKTQIWKDGWVMLESEGVSTMDQYDIDFDQYKYRVEVVAVRREKSSE